jgi:hypothetical protein
VVRCRRRSSGFRRSAASREAASVASFLVVAGFAVGSALLVLCAPLLLLAAWMWTYGVRVLRANRHPPPGVRLVRDTAVSRGAAAGRYGRLYQVFAAVLVVATLIVVRLVWALWRLQ